jgi:Ca2+/Na+ antiporter
MAMSNGNWHPEMAVDAVAMSNGNWHPEMAVDAVAMSNGNGGRGDDDPDRLAG